MRKHSKKQVAAFYRRVDELATKLGFSAYPADEPGYDSNANKLRVMTDCGIYNLSLHRGKESTEILDINGRFKEIVRAAKFTNGSSNPFSGKWNVLNRDPDACLAHFEENMRFVNARPPTPEEALEWAEQDAKEAEELRVSRIRWKQYIKDNPI